MPGVVALRLYYLASFAVLGVYLPFFPPWLAARGIEGVHFGLLMATYPAMGVIGPPVFGLVADALGLRGHLLRVACAGAFVGFAGVAALAGAGGGTFAALLLPVVVFAFFRTPMTMLGDVVALEAAREGHVPYGMTRLFGSMGFLVAAILAGGLEPTSAVQIPLAIAALLLVTLGISFALPSRVPVPARPSAAQIRALLTSADVRLFLASAFFAQVAFACYDQCFSLHLLARGASPRILGATWAVGVSAEVVLMANASALAARVRAPVLLAIAYGVAVLRWILIGFVPGFWPLLVLQPLHAITFGLPWVSALAYVKDRAPKHLLGTAQGVFVATISLGSVTGMLGWIHVYRRGGGALAFGGAALVSALACGIAIAFARRTRAGRNEDS
ncbi:MFS transporter [Polyangium jinanense]|uniref:MFS transporter n=1 Tax=Polyangium jinanense TaxID=2829994 RepID=A0A9X3X5M3_9BACT|nr:MFS transporter [Polyangium jinanense]MDC3956140.1 MFS transporter [Polyangium jinanense]MDC3983025.1 MFS transporter [Polyangium jinanense]